jgi:hypothetical protein
MTWSRTLDAKRQTGRTYRLCKKALELASAGRAVYIIAYNNAHRVTIVDELWKQSKGAAPNGIKVEVQDRFDEFNWRTMTLPRAHPNCVVLVDHHTIEEKFMRVLEALHQFDEEE